MAPLPVELMAPLPCTGLKIRFVQVSARLSMPLGEDKVVNDESCAGYTWQPTLPVVKREIVIRLQMFYRNEQGRWQDLWQSSLVKVYPKTLLDPLRVWAQHHPLIVKDRNGKLAAFLAQQAITFRTRRFDTRTLSDIKPVYFVTDPDSSKLSGTASWNTEYVNIVFFHERIYNISKIKSLNTKHGTRIDVEMKLLDKLTTDPLAQKVLLEIFRMSQNTTYTEEN